MNDSLDQFLALVKKYVEIPELTTTIVNELIKKIIVYAPDKLKGNRIQRIKIIFNFLGEVDLPTLTDRPGNYQLKVCLRKTKALLSDKLQDEIILQDISIMQKDGTTVRSYRPMP